MRSYQFTSDEFVNLVITSKIGQFTWPELARYIMICPTCQREVDFYSVPFTRGFRCPKCLTFHKEIQFGLEKDNPPGDGPHLCPIGWQHAEINNN